MDLISTLHFSQVYGDFVSLPTSHFLTILAYLCIECHLTVCHTNILSISSQCREGRKDWETGNAERDIKSLPRGSRDNSLFPFKESNQLSSHECSISLANEAHRQLLLRFPSELERASFLQLCVLIENCLSPTLCSHLWPLLIMKLVMRLCVSTCPGRSCLVL